MGYCLLWRLSLAPSTHNGRARPLGRRLTRQRRIGGMGALLRVRDGAEGARKAADGGRQGAAAAPGRGGAHQRHDISSTVDATRARSSGAVLATRARDSRSSGPWKHQVEVERIRGVVGGTRARWRQPGHVGSRLKGPDKTDSPATAPLASLAAQSVLLGPLRHRRQKTDPGLEGSPLPPGEGSKGTKKGPNRTDAPGLARSEGRPIFRGKMGVCLWPRVEADPPLAASIPAAATKPPPG